VGGDSIGVQAIPSDDRSTVAASMEQPNLTPAKCFVRDLVDAQEVDSVFLVRAHSRRHKRSGEPFLKLQLGDVTGAVEAVVWDGVDNLAPACPTGAVVRVVGHYTVDERYGGGITVRALRTAAEGEYAFGDLVDGPPIDYEQMATDLAALAKTVQRPHLRDLLRRLIGSSSEAGRAWRAAPAAKYYHQAYRHGLLEHCLSLAQGVSALAATFPAIDRDIAVTGALLHDIGKVGAYALANGAIELTDAGKLQGEIALGYYTVRREIERIEGFPADDAEALLHIILSHHGKLEHGSPVMPCTREATLVHFIDNLGGNLGSFDRIEKALAEGERWSAFDRGLSTSAYFAPRAQSEEPREAA
jgi:3'-5' exoribonuclease